MDLEENSRNRYRSENDNPLNSKFFDTSCEDSSSTGSIGETTSAEVWRLLETIKQDSAIYAVKKTTHDGNKKIVNLTATRPKKTDYTISSSNDDSTSRHSHPPLLIKDHFSKIKINFTTEYRKKILMSLPCTHSDDISETEHHTFGRYIKIIIMVAFWLFCTAILIQTKEKVTNMHQLSLSRHETKSYWISEQPKKESLSVSLEGAFLPNYYANLSTRFLDIWVEAFEQDSINNKTSSMENRILNQRKVSDVISIPIVNEQLIDDVPNIRVNEDFVIMNASLSNKTYFRIQLKTNLKCSFPVSINYDLSPVDMEYGVFYAALVLILLYILIIFEIIHRTLAGMLAAAMSVAILAALDERPSVSALASWIDFETLLLLFSMMVLVAVFSETGVFDYMSVYTYKITNGKVWPLINTLCFITFFLSSFLDNVTTALLMTPVTIRLCEVTELNPVPVLMAMTIFSNIGGAITPVGDPPNVIVASHPDVVAAGVNFGVFFLHMIIGISLVAVIVHFQLRLMFRCCKVFGYDEPQDVQDLRHEIAIWQRAAASLSSYSKDEDTVKDTLSKRARRLLMELKTRLTSSTGPPYANYKKNLDQLKEKYPIKSKALLIKSGLALSFVIVVFFLHSIPGLHLSLGCTAFMGALLLLIIADRPHMEGILARVEWSTLLFFASLFILMEALSRLRLIEWIGQRTEQIILGVSSDYQLSVAILLILWVSAGVSAFVDNIPLTTMMIRIVTSLAKNPELGLPLLPLVWALCYGACLGGVATLIGSSSNVVCAGVAEQHGHRFTFMQYSKVGLPVTFISLIVISAYLMIVHVALGWNT